MAAPSLHPSCRTAQTAPVSDHWNGIHRKRRELFPSPADDRGDQRGDQHGTGLLIASQRAKRFVKARVGALGPFGLPWTPPWEAASLQRFTPTSQLMYTATRQMDLPSGSSALSEGQGQGWGPSQKAAFSLPS